MRSVLCAIALVAGLLYPASAQDFVAGMGILTTSGSPI